MDDVAYRCRDDLVIGAPPEACFAPIVDLTSYERWWTLVRIEPLIGGTHLKFGVRFRYWGARPGGESVTWIAQVTEVVAPVRVELDYVTGDLVGRAAWELDPVADGTRVSYVYRGVRANSAVTRASFAHFGTRLHSVSMREDALAGLARHVAGYRAELDDASWRAHVLARVAARIRELA